MRSIAFALLFAVALVACDTTEPPPQPRTQTLLRGFLFAPNDTVAVGDTMTVTALIRDSLDTRFEFCWNPPFGRARSIPAGPPPGELFCTGPSIQFVAPESLRAGNSLESFRFTVSVDNGVYVAEDGARLTPIYDAGSRVYVTTVP